jgi:hypothetical protein
MGHSCDSPFGLQSYCLLVTTSFSGLDRMDNLLKDHRCPILAQRGWETITALPLPNSPPNLSSRAQSRDLRFLFCPVAVLGCPILDEVKGGISLLKSPFSIAGLRGETALALLLCSPLARARSAIHPFPNVAGPALERFALLLCSPLPRARSAIHPFPNVAGPALKRFALQNCHPERSRGICGFLSVPVTVLGVPHP